MKPMWNVTLNVFFFSTIIASRHGLSTSHFMEVMSLSGHVPLCLGINLWSLCCRAADITVFVSDLYLNDPLISVSFASDFISISFAGKHAWVNGLYLKMGLTSLLTHTVFWNWCGEYNILPRTDILNLKLWSCIKASIVFDSQHPTHIFYILYDFQFFFFFFLTEIKGLRRFECVEENTWKLLFWERGIDVNLS